MLLFCDPVKVIFHRNLINNLLSVDGCNLLKAGYEDFSMLAGETLWLR